MSFWPVQLAAVAGLRKLAPSVASALGSHRGTLVLDGLRELEAGD